MDKPDQEKKEPEDAFTISALAEEFDISTRTIRFYEEKNMIFSPAHRWKPANLFPAGQGKA